MTAAMTEMAYPVRLEIDYPERLSRWKTLLRIVLAIPVMIVSALVGIAAFVVMIGVFLTLLFARRYPRSWFDFLLWATRYTQRVNAYVGLLTDRYPAFSDEQSVHLEIDYPDAAQELSRWMPLVKWLLAIPHLVVLWLLSIVVSVTTAIAWVVILLTARYPRGLFDLAVGASRWNQRVSGYAMLLVTDRYPPFKLEA